MAIISVVVDVIIGCCMFAAALPEDMASALRALNIVCPTPDDLLELLSHATLSKH